VIFTQFYQFFVILESEKQKKKVHHLKNAWKMGFFSTIFALALFGVFSPPIWRIQCQKIWQLQYADRVNTRAQGRNKVNF